MPPPLSLDTGKFDELDWVTFLVLVTFIFWQPCAGHRFSEIISMNAKSRMSYAVNTAWFFVTHALAVAGAWYSLKQEKEGDPYFDHHISRYDIVNSFIFVGFVLAKWWPATVVTWTSTRESENKGWYTVLTCATIWLAFISTVIGIVIASLAGVLGSLFLLAFLLWEGIGGICLFLDINNDKAVSAFKKYWTTTALDYSRGGKA